MAQEYNRLLQFNAGFSNEEIAFKRGILAFNDTSQQQFDFISKSPLICYSHTLILSDKFAISGRVGYQYLNIKFDHQYYGSPFAFFTLNPTLTLFLKKRFEYYVKLNIGASVWFNNPDVLPTVFRRIFPEKVTAITGFTPIGLNYFINDKFGINAEVSIWTPALLTFGINYRFLRNSSIKKE